MKYLLILSLAFASTSLCAGELDNIDLLTPVTYEKPSKTSQTIASKIKLAIGNLIKIDLNQEVKKQIDPEDRAALSSFFPKNGELDAFVDSIVNEGKQTIKDHLSDKKMIHFYELLGNKLVGGIADRILASKGVKDPERRNLWTQKLLVPFKNCINTSKNSLYDASYCLTALTASLPPNIGMGLVYEISKSRLSSAIPEDQQSDFILSQVKNYTDCLKKAAGNTNDVETCAIRAMQSGVLKVSDFNLTSTLEKQASSPTVGKSIKNNVLPGFNNCIVKVGSSQNEAIELGDQFIDCIDNLIKVTGKLLVHDKISNNDAVKSSFNEKDIAVMNADKVKKFETCILNNKKNNIRKDGILDTNNCEILITNEVTYQVVIKSLSDTAKDIFKTEPHNIVNISNEGKNILDRCWEKSQTPDKREECLRKTIISFSQVIASFKLNDAIPTYLKNKDDIKDDSLKDLTKCLEEKLPQNISEAKNLKTSTDFCSNALTLKVALKAAQGAVFTKAIENKASEADASKMVSIFVEKGFMDCLGATPDSKKIDKCSGELKRNVSISLISSRIRESAKGKMVPAEIEILINKLVNHNFTDCVGPTPSDNKMLGCINNLTKAATKSIVLSYEKMQIRDKLNITTTPEKLKPVENNFIACIDKPYKTEVVSKSIDECTKQFALGFASILGDLKLNSLMKSVLGLETYNLQKKSIDAILSKYNECLQNLKQVDMEDGLLDKLTVCTIGLEQRGMSFVSNTVKEWMSTEAKDEMTIKVKNEFAQIIPCLGGLLPASAPNQKIEENADSILKPAALLLAQYIDYSPGDAKRSLESVIQKLSTDLKDVSTNPESRLALINLLYKNGALDQFLKSMIKSEVQESFGKQSEEDLPNELRAALINKNNFDKIFANSEGKAVKDLAMEKILKPLLMDQEKLKSPKIVAGMEILTNKVVRLLANSPYFGEQIIKTNVQNKINNLGGIYRFMAKILYGNNSLNWDKVRITPEGMEAENYIKENILIPKFKGITLSEAEKKIYDNKAQELVTKAVKQYE